MKQLRFGVEIELDGLDVEDAREVVRDYLDGDHDHLGRSWTVCADASVPTGFELVTPPMYYADIPLLQELFRRLRLKGARRSQAAGIHVHVSAKDFSPQQLTSLVNLYANNSELLIKLLNVYTSRRVLYCQPILPFAMRLRDLPSLDFDSIRVAWYEDDDPARMADRYDHTRYTELNVHSYFYRGTIEFRAFNSTNHAGKMKSFIVLVLSMLSKALRFPGVLPLSPANLGKEHDAIKRAMEFFDLVRITDVEFSNARSHLLTNLRRHFRTRHTDKYALVFRYNGLSFDGGSAAEVLEEMSDNYFFLLKEPQEFLRAIRLSRDPKNEAVSDDVESGLAILKHLKDNERFALDLLHALESRGIGTLRVIGGPG